MPLNEVNFEVGQSKQCLLDHGINSNIFAYPFNEGPNDPIIFNTVARYYDIAGSGNIPLQFLNVATDRYSVAGINVVLATQTTSNSYYDSQKLANFIKLVNSQDKYNAKGGPINAIPIIVYHTIDYNNQDPNNTNPDLFSAEMKYLYDNGFRELTMTDLKYSQNANSL